MTVTQAEFFGWRAHPFADTQTKFTTSFLATQDRKLVGQGLSLLSIAKSFALTGDSGLGKTTLIAQIMNQLDTHHYLPILLAYGGLNRSAVLRTLAEQLGVDPAGRAPLLVKLQKQFRELREQTNAPFPILFIDDAHYLERETLLDLCALLNLPGKGTAAAAMVLIGHPILTQSLKLHLMAPVRTRITATFPMEPLDESNCLAFLKHRLDLAKAPQDLFDREALNLLASTSRGNRREIVNLATLALEEAFVLEQKTIGVQLLLSLTRFDSE
jgi:type II secretory pathway predicted ATPase ExeA